MIHQGVSGLAKDHASSLDARGSALLGTAHRYAKTRKQRPQAFTRNTPRRVFALMSPHSANIDRIKIDQHYGGILAHAQPVCARGKEFSGIGRYVSELAGAL